MDTKTAEILCKINNDFYQSQSESFSKTRKAPWPGWERCMRPLRDAVCDGSLGQAGGARDSRASEGGNRQLAVLDLACGNMRFASFLDAAFPEADIAYYGVDDCDGLAAPFASRMPQVRYQSLDVLGVLHEGQCLNDRLDAPTCGLSVSFGFLHHIPLAAQREEVLASLIRQTQAGGYAAVSFWRFLDDPAMRGKAQAAHQRALKELGLRGLEGELGADDYLLGWKNMPGIYRYCHSFTESEIDQIAESASGRAVLVDRFRSDGRTSSLNTYLVFKACAENRR
ncbi:MAG: class I SAM-dependent methyltransferase [Eggerthellaceae bacterium]|nr:class I SAM-dependent methyltransferase [Eggerthellaceae bacterium]